MIQHRRQYLGDNMNHNYCRAADPSDPKPWCYTTDPYVRWEYCDCEDSYYSVVADASQDSDK